MEFFRLLCQSPEMIGVRRGFEQTPEFAVVETPELWRTRATRRTNLLLCVRPMQINQGELDEPQ